MPWETPNIIRPLKWICNECEHPVAEPKVTADYHVISWCSNCFGYVLPIEISARDGKTD
jgi:hypothetical protein